MGCLSAVKFAPHSFIIKNGRKNLWRMAIPPNIECWVSSPNNVMNKTKEIDMKNVRKVLVLNMLSTTIGDVVFLTPFFRILKKRFPKKQITITTSPPTKKIFENNPHVDKIIVIKDLEKISKKIPKIKKAFIYFNLYRKLIFELRKKKFDLAIVVWPNFFIMQLIPKLTGIKYSVGYDYKGSYFSFLMTKKCKFKDQINYPNRHFLESYLDLLKLIKVDAKKDEKYVEIFLSDKDKKKAKDVLKKNGIKNKDVVIAFQCGANWPNKTWYYKNFIEVAKKLFEINNNIKIVLLGSPAEYKTNDKVRKAFPKKIINLAGKIPLDDVLGVISQSKLMIGNDSGLMHISGAVGTPTIVICGVGNPKHSRVLGKSKSIVVFKNDFCKPCMTNNRNCKLNYKCMKVVKPEDVMKEVERVL